MHAKRTIFKNEILCEFFPPEKPSNNVMVFAPGMPGLPSSKRAAIAAKHGYWGITLRYRG